MGQGNVMALKHTLDSFHGIVDEVVYGDMLIFEEDRLTLESYKEPYNLRPIRLPFNFIFKQGFAACLNYLAANASNDMVMYMNTSEAIDEDYGINKIIDENPEQNSFYFIHRTDPHRWHRTYNRKELFWSGVIHEELRELPGKFINPYHKPIFMMKDHEKDMDNTFKAAVFNSIKELVYFNNYLKLIDDRSSAGATNEGWVTFAKEQYSSMLERMQQKGKQLTAFQLGDFDMLYNELKTSDYFEKERFESSDIINFQGNRKIVL